MRHGLRRRRNRLLQGISRSLLLVVARIPGVHSGSAMAADAPPAAMDNGGSPLVYTGTVQPVCGRGLRSAEVRRPYLKPYLKQHYKRA